MAIYMETYLNWGAPKRERQVVSSWFSGRQAAGHLAQPRGRLFCPKAQFDEES